MAAEGDWPGCWLLAVDGSSRTKAARHDAWYVTNPDVALPRADRAALNRLLRVPEADRDHAKPWLADREGRYRGPTFGRPDDLPTDDGHWDFERWCIAPDGSRAVFEMRDRYSGGYCCAKRDDIVHLGQMDRRTGALLQLTFTSRHRQVQPIWSPDGERILYVREEAVGLASSPPQRDLWVMRRDGWDDRLLARNVSWSHQWLNTDWVAYSTSRDPESRDLQLGIADVRTGEGQLLTRGPFRHVLCDFRDGRFLVEEHPLGPSGHTTHSCDLYIIEPLRVRM